MTFRKMQAALATFVFSALISACGGGSSAPPPGPPPPPPPPPVRPVNSSCLAVDKPVPAADYQLVDISEGIGTIRAMTKIAQAPGQPNYWYILEEAGWVKRFAMGSGEAAQIWLNFRPVRSEVSAGRGRTLGIAFDPDFPATPRVYIYYTGEADGAFQSVLLRYTLDDIDAPVSPTIETILTVAQDDSQHKGGDIAFGPDGYLYLALGDGGGVANRQNGQDTGNLYGTMLRLDVSGNGDGYAIPGDNPFAGAPACADGPSGQNCPEIYAWGLRNPFRWGFDASGILWAGDVGELRREEINQIEKGKNYGWPCQEGSLNFQTQFCAADAELEPPVFEYDHSGGGASVTAGNVYAGTALPELQGRYFFADFVSGDIWALRDGANGFYESEQLLTAGFFIPSIEVGLDGEIYVGDRSNMRIMRLEALNGGGVNTIPQKLADTGCFDGSAPGAVTDGVVPYELNTPFWSDGAEKSRFFAVPDGTTVDIDENDDFVFPHDSVLIKHFRLGGKLIETRLLMRHEDGTWGGYTWEWNDDESEANRVIGGKIRDVDGLQWQYPSESQCSQCHTSVAGFTIGPQTAQLNGDATYPDPFNATENQLALLNTYGYFTDPQPDPSTLPELTVATDVTADLNDRARAWLHSNCSNCHQPGGPTPASIDLRYTTDLQDTNTCGRVPGESLGIPNARIIAPADPDRSVLLQRLSRRGENQMPPIGSNLADAAGVQLITDWIASLQNCN